MTAITMSQTVGELTSGQSYFVRARNAQEYIVAGKATVAKTKINVPPAPRGHK